MQKNEARTALSAMLQRNSEILTKILEEKRSEKPPFQALEVQKRRLRSPKAGKTMPFPSENNAFIEGKHPICRGKTCTLPRENIHVAPLKQTFSCRKTAQEGRFPFPLGRMEKRGCQPKACFPVTLCPFPPESMTC
ncbi:hypothetical protein H7U35_06220 [Mediterranea massiliensis]|uniref:Uncharacterized protein n=1 Tax=Mediterranea massiliensis TaxID=1841865 RepID=A0ABS2DZL3_9BACT|nr:hypothetical protein [Mediterranea massiliensis]MBM6734813.1 hypothetical protein [Mediterranea massiliensis]